jgi:DNA-binding transcriptional LysR family regulator
MAMPDTEEIVAIEDCRWEDNNCVMAALDHPLCGKPGITPAYTLDQQWAIPPRGTAPFEHMQQVFVADGLGLPNVVVETRSITVLKSLVARSGFLSWMDEHVRYGEQG